MSAINFHTKEISVKIVYYGPGLCGKTTSLQTIYKSLPEAKRPRLVSLATEVDRTIFFDFLPITAYRIRDFNVRLQLYTVPGQVFYNATRKLVLNGVDGLVFVADSQKAMRDSNVESLENLADNLAELGLDLGEVPIVMQFNKRDLQEIDSVQEMDQLYNPRKLPVFATIATAGEGLFETLKTISQMVVNDLIRKGLGQQLQQQAKAVAAVAEADAAPDGFAALGAAVSEAVETVEPMREEPDSLLWPSGDTKKLGDKIVAGLEVGNWAAAVLAAEELLEFEVRRWSEAEGRNASDATATFLYLRGVPASRYRSYLQALVAARAGKPLTRGSALGALVLALEAIW